MLSTDLTARRHALDALRGIAILLVVTWHYLPQPWTPVRGEVFTAIRRANVLSWSGVDLFFVLSGFLIVGILLDNRLATNYFRTFYIRRFYRIVPLYAVVLVFAALAIDWPSSWKAYLAHLVFQQNAVVAATGAWGLPRLEVTWSLAVEEQFYMLAPLVVRFVRPQRLPGVLLGCIVAAPISRLAVGALMPSELAPFAAITLLPCRIDSLAVGALLVWAARDQYWRRVVTDRRLLAIAGVLFGTLGIVVPMTAGWAWPSVYVWTIGLTFIALFYGVVLVVFLTPWMERTVRLPLFRPLTAAGIGAYSIYLFHLAIRNTASVTVATRSGLWFWVVYAAVLIGGNIAIAWCCWRLIERPMIRRGHRHHYDMRDTGTIMPTAAIPGREHLALGRRSLDQLRGRFPAAYWRARNAVAIAHLYAHRLQQSVTTADAYSDSFWIFHDRGDWDGFARVVLAHAPVRSVVDVGCGHGLTLAGLARVDPTLRLRGFDESPSALRRAKERGLPVEPLDILALSQVQASSVAAELASFDLGICLEVAEHLPSWHSDKLLTIVASPKWLVFSAAHPNQGGRFHVNEQPARYWIDRLAKRGFALAPADDAFRAAIAALDLPHWYGQNVHLFERGR